jgi:hypothetical protein
VDMLLQQYPDRAEWIRALAVHDQETKMPNGFVG